MDRTKKLLFIGIALAFVINELATIASALSYNATNNWNVVIAVNFIALVVMVAVVIAILRRTRFAKKGW